jgi:hypothetical protein
MRISLRICSAGVVAGVAFLGFSAGSVYAQAVSSCVQNCQSGGWSYSQCARYCDTTIAADSKLTPRAPRARVYGYNPPVYGYSPPVYGYYRGASGGCGQYRYLKGGQCVDARSDPPILR